MEIDIERLREDIKQDYYAAFFVGGFGGALVESIDIDNASPDKLIEMSKEKRIDLRKYIVID